MTLAFRQLSLTSRNKLIETASFVVAAVLAVSHGSAATIDVDTVLGPDHPYVDESIVVVDGANPPTDVTIVDGALVGDALGGEIVPIGLEAFGRSRITMVQGGISAGQRSVLLHDESSFRMLNGGIDRGIEARDQSRVNIEGGSWGAVWGYDSSRLRISGPRDQNDSLVETFGNSHAVIEGVDEYSLVTADSSTAVVRGGEFHRIDATGNSRILIDGGMFSDSSPGAYENGIVDMWSIERILEEPIVAAGNGIVNIYGTDLRFDVLDDEGNLIPFVAGNLADGDRFAAEYRILDQGQIILHEVPEPGALAMLAVGAGALLAARRRRMGSLAGAAG